MKREISEFLKSKFGKIILTLFIFLVLIIVVLLVISLKNKITTKIIKEAVYQINNEERTEFDSAITIDSKENTITEIKKGNKKINLDSNPIYYKNEDKVIFPTNMAVIFPKSNVSQYKINYFSTVEKEGKTVYIRGNKLNYPIQNAFIYDGDNLYFFIEETNVLINDINYTLSPLSYVILNYDNNIQMYDYDKDEITMLEISGSNVTASTDNYKINMSIDAVDYDGGSRLLLKQFDYLKNLK